MGTDIAEFLILTLEVSGSKVGNQNILFCYFEVLEPATDYLRLLPAPACDRIKPQVTFYTLQCLFPLGLSVRVGKQLDRRNKRKAPTALEPLLSQFALIHSHTYLTREQRDAYITNAFSYTNGRFSAGVSAEENAWQPETA